MELIGNIFSPNRGSGAKFDSVCELIKETSELIYILRFLGGTSSNDMAEFADISCGFVNDI